VKRQECKRYDTCSAPLCPMDDQSLQNGIWYPDEEICHNQAYRSLTWIKNQKKIAKKACPVGIGPRKKGYDSYGVGSYGAGAMDRYFTLKMLDRNIVIRKGIEGLDPDHDEAYQLRRWLKAHPEKRELSKTEREERATRMTTLRRRQIGGR